MLSVGLLRVGLYNSENSGSGTQSHGTSYSLEGLGFVAADVLHFGRRFLPVILGLALEDSHWARKARGLEFSSPHALNPTKPYKPQPELKQQKRACGLSFGS